MRNTKKGFTLVELIVVITILAILGTIAFISLGSYTADARNAKRLDGISKLATAIDNDQLSGKSLMAYVADDTNRVTAMSVGGVAATAGTDYEAGSINATALNVKADQFKDPTKTAELYRIGVSTKAGGVYEVAATVEEGSTAKAAVKGNYSPRSADAATAGSGATSVTLSDVTDINFFNVGDTTTQGVITAISPDGLTITTDGASTATATSIALSAAESDGLVGTSGGDAVTSNDTTNFPYPIN